MPSIPTINKISSEKILKVLNICNTCPILESAAAATPTGQAPRFYPPTAQAAARTPVSPPGVMALMKRTKAPGPPTGRLLLCRLRVKPSQATQVAGRRVPCCFGWCQPVSQSLTSPMLP